MHVIIILKIYLLYHLQVNVLIRFSWSHTRICFSQIRKRDAISFVVRHTVDHKAQLRTDLWYDFFLLFSLPRRVFIF